MSMNGNGTGVLDHDVDDRSIEEILTELGVRTDVEPGTPALTPGAGNCNAYKPSARELAGGGQAWSAAFRHPISGAQTAKVTDTEDDAWRISRLMFDLWVRNGRPSPSKRPKERAAAAVKGEGSPFDPAIAALWGTELTVTMIGLDENDEPIMALRNDKQTVIVNVKGYQLR